MESRVVSAPLNGCSQMGSSGFFGPWGVGRGHPAFAGAALNIMAARMVAVRIFGIKLTPQ
jgi:hypothetical protein